MADQRLTENETQVLAYLQGKDDFTSPTVIGKDVGGGRRHSSWASPICKRLVSRGLLVRSDNGWYKTAN